MFQNIVIYLAIQIHNRPNGTIFTIFVWSVCELRHYQVLNIPGRASTRTPRLSYTVASAASGRQREPHNRGKLLQAVVSVRYQDTRVQDTTVYGRRLCRVAPNRPPPVAHHRPSTATQRPSVGSRPMDSGRGGGGEKVTRSTADAARQAFRVSTKPVPPDVPRSHALALFHDAITSVVDVRTSSAVRRRREAHDARGPSDRWTPLHVSFFRSARFSSSARAQGFQPDVVHTYTYLHIVIFIKCYAQHTKCILIIRV